MTATGRTEDTGWPAARRVRCLVALAALSIVSGCATQSLRYADWQQVETAHFEIVSALSDDKTRQLAEDLETFRRAIEFMAKRPLERRTARIRVYAFNGRALIRPFDRRTVTGYLVTSLTNATIVLRGGDGFRGDATPGLRRDLANLLLGGSVNSGRPLWYDRGLAELLSTVWIERRSVRVGVPRKDLLALIRDRPWTPMESHLRIGDLASRGKRGRAEFAAQSWLLVHYLTLGSKNRDDIQTWLGRALRAEAFQMDALLLGLGGGRPLDGVLLDYQQRGRFSSLVLRIEPAAEGAVMGARPLTDPEVSVALGALSLELVRARQARSDFDRVLDDDPGHLEALAGRQLAEAQEERFAALPSQLAEAIAGKEASPRARLWVGEAALLEARASDDPERRRVLAERVRAQALASVRMSSEVAGAAALFAASYDIPGEDAELGLEAVSRARGRTPDSSEVQLVHARLLARLDRVAASRELAAGVVSRASEPALRREAESLVESLGVTLLQ